MRFLMVWGCIYLKRGTVAVRLCGRGVDDGVEAAAVVHVAHVSLCRRLRERLLYLDQAAVRAALVTDLVRLR